MNVINLTLERVAELLADWDTESLRRYWNSEILEIAECLAREIQGVADSISGDDAWWSQFPSYDRARDLNGRQEVIVLDVAVALARKGLTSDRRIVNFLRHELTNYDSLLREGEDRSMLKAEILSGIAEAYPYLAEECERQAREARENE
jgi:hypothetical protein